MNKISRIGLDNLERLARLDAEVRDRIDAYDREESEAKANSLGNLTGSLAGLGGAVYSEYSGKPGGADISGQQATQRTAADSVSANTVLGENSVIAEKDDSTLKQKTDAYAGNGLGSATIRGSIDQAQPDILKDRSVVSMRSPRRSYLTSLYGGTSDDFKIAFNDVVSSFPPSFIGS